MSQIEFLDLNPFVLQDFSWRASIPGGGFAASRVGIFLNSRFGKMWNYSRAVLPRAPGLLWVLAFFFFFSLDLVGKDYWVMDGAGIFPSLGDPGCSQGLGQLPHSLFPLNV